MAQFRILKGPSSRIDQGVTAFHDGYAYFTPDDAGFYIDSEDGGVQKRIRINPVYTPGGNAGQVTIDIDNNAHKISASIVAGSIGTSEIADANVTKEKLSTEVQSSIERAVAAGDAVEAKADASKAVTVTLAASAWAGANAPFTQELTVTGLQSGTNGMVNVAHSATAAQRDCAREAMLSVTGQADGKLIVVADGELPEVDIPVCIILIG